MNANLIKGVWQEGVPVVPANLTGTAFQAEAEAHTIEITCLNADGSAASVSGTVTAKVLRSDGVTRVLTGTLSGNVVSVTLTQMCYEAPGRLTIAVYLTTGSREMVLWAAVANVYRTTSGEEWVEDGTVIPTLSNLTEALNNAIAATQAANNAAAAANTARLALQDTIDTQVNAAGYPYTASGSSVTVHPVADSRIDFVAHVNPVQAGSGDPSPSNVRAITAPESVTIKRFGANLLNKTGISSSSGTVTQTDTGIMIATTSAASFVSAQYAGLTPHLVNGVTYTVSARISALTARARIQLRGISSSDSIFQDRLTTGILSLTFTWDSSKYDVLQFFCTYTAASTDSVTYDDIMLVQGDTAADYVPWAGWTKVELTAPSGTYGGDYDSHGSFVPMRFGNVSSGSRTYANFGSKAGNLYIGNVLASDLTTADVTIADVSRYFCTMYKPMPYVGIDDREDNCIYFGNGSIYIRDTAHMTAQTAAGLDAYFSWLDSAGGMSICAPYLPSKAPAATSVDAKTLRATDAAQLNHVWTNNGTVTVSGAQDMQYTIDELRAEIAGY